MNRLFRLYKAFCLSVIAMIVMGLSGCSQPKASNRTDIKQFNQAGRVVLISDPNEIVKTFVRKGPYRIIPGDVLEFHMPAILRVTSVEQLDQFKSDEPHLCRVTDEGNVTLPIIGDIYVTGKTVGEVEKIVYHQYFPQYIVTPTAVVCTIREHMGQRVISVVGLVKEPGVFEYPYDVEYNLMEAIAQAKGVDIVSDPRYATVYRKDVSGQVLAATFRIDRDYFLDATEVMLMPGDVVSVEETPRTRMNRFINDLFYIRAGADLDI